MAGSIAEEQKKLEAELDEKEKQDKAAKALIEDHMRKITAVLQNVKAH